MKRLPPRKADSHKGDYGRVLVVAGSRGKAGDLAARKLGQVSLMATDVLAALPDAFKKP